MSVSGLPYFTLNANCPTGDGLALSSLSALSSASLSHPRVIASLVIPWGFLVVAVMLTKIMAKPIKIRTCNITVSLGANGGLRNTAMREFGTNDSHRRPVLRRSLLTGSTVNNFSFRCVRARFVKPRVFHGNRPPAFSYCYRFTDQDGCSSPAPPDIAGGSAG